MRYITKIIMLVLVLFLINCSDSKDGNSNPLGLEPLGGGSVTFQVSVQQDQQGLWYFVFKPSASIKVTKVEASKNNQSEGSIQGDGTTVYAAADPFSVQVNNPSDGEKWTFVVTGKIADDNKDFTSTVNYTIPQGTGGGAGNVTFDVSVHQQQGQNGFLLKPSVDIKLAKIELTLNGQSAGTVNGDGTTVFTNASGLFLSLNAAATSGEKWDFIVTGTIANDGKAFSSNITYTVP